jgi:hypothetical protein
MRYNIKSERKERVLAPVSISIRYGVLFGIPESVVVCASGRNNSNVSP